MIDDDEEDEKNAWLMTYADMVTLLLTFFVLLLTMAEFDVSRVMDAVNSMQGALGVLPPGSDKPIMEEFSDLIETIEKMEGVTAKKATGGLMIKLPNRVAFGSGKASLKPEAMMILSNISKILKEKYTENEVNIRGHTDNVPINTLEFPSNWVLSTTRATNVLRYLVKIGMQKERLSVAGYGEFRPADGKSVEESNRTKDGRSKNRRMEIYIEKL